MSSVNSESSTDLSLRLAVVASTAPIELYLPQELADLILWHLQESCGSDSVSFKRNIFALALAARTFSCACKRVLFKTVVLQPKVFVVNSIQLQGPETALRFSKLIAESPHLATLVRTLVYRFPYSTEYRDGNNQLLIAALSKLDYVTELRLEGSEGDRTRWQNHSAVNKLEIFTSKLRRTGVRGELLKIMQRSTTKTLKLKNVTVPIIEMGKMKGVERLELDKSVAMSSLDTRVLSPEEMAKVTPLFLKHFAYKGSYKVNERVFDTNRLPSVSTDYFRPQWDELETLSLPIQDSHRRKRSDLPHTILATAKRLKSLNMHTMSRFNPSGSHDTSTVPHVCPMVHLHPDSCNTLTRISFIIEFDLRTLTGDDIIHDPYHGLLLDGVLQKCVNLEEVSVRAIINGYRWRYMTRELFWQPWGALDEALAPKGVESPFPRLKKVELRVVNTRALTIRDAFVYRPGLRMKLAGNLGGLRALRDAGRIELCLGVHKRRVRRYEDEGKRGWEEEEFSDFEDLGESDREAEEFSHTEDLDGSDSEAEEAVEESTSEEEEEEESDGDEQDGSSGEE